MLHCGANAVNREQVEEVKTPKNEGRWHPISHAYLIGELIKRLPTFGMRVVEEAHGLFHNKKSGAEGDRYFGMFQVEPDEGNESNDFSLVFGLRNSHDKSFAAGLALGSGVFVCDNLAFSGEVTLARRHTTNIINDLPNIINTAVSKLVDARASQAKRIEAYKESDLSRTEAQSLIIDMLRANAINVTTVPKVLEQWDTPAHPEFKERNGWSMFNAVTEALKGSSLVQLPGRTTKLHAVMDNFAGITLDAVAAVRKEFEDNEDVNVN